MARLLLVEDNEMNLELMTYLLTKFGHEVVGAENGEAALALLDHERVDLVVCDVNMPKMDGPHFLAALHARPEMLGLPVIAVTGSARVGDREALLAAGFHGYLSKPIEPRQFVGQVEAFLRDTSASRAPNGT